MPKIATKYEYSIILFWMDCVWLTYGQSDLAGLLLSLVIPLGLVVIFSVYTPQHAP